MKKRILALCAVVLMMAFLAVPALAEGVPEESIGDQTADQITEVVEFESASDRVNGQVAKVIYDFWSFWFPSEWVAAYPDLFVLLTIVSTLALVFGIIIRPLIKLCRW